MYVYRSNLLEIEAQWDVNSKLTLGKPMQSCVGSCNNHNNVNDQFDCRLPNLKFIVYFDNSVLDEMATNLYLKKNRFRHKGLNWIIERVI